MWKCTLHTMKHLYTITLKGAVPLSPQQPTKVQPLPCNRPRTWPNPRPWPQIHRQHQRRRERRQHWTARANQCEKLVSNANVWNRIRRIHTLKSSSCSTCAAPIRQRSPSSSNKHSLISEYFIFFSRLSNYNAIVDLYPANNVGDSFGCIHNFYHPLACPHKGFVGFYYLNEHTKVRCEWLLLKIADWSHFCGQLVTRLYN